VELPDEVATYLLNQKREELFRLEKIYGLKLQIVGQPGLPHHQINIEFTRKDSSRGERAQIKKKEEPMPGEGRVEKVTPEEADRLAIEELKKETKESFLKKFLWPSALWRGIIKPSAPPTPPAHKGPGEVQETSGPPRKREDLH
jgi:hypothetical protein